MSMCFPSVLILLSSSTMSALREAARRLLRIRGVYALQQLDAECGTYDYDLLHERVHRA